MHQVEKTTLVPPLLAMRTRGRVIVTQPRRVAARAAARRLAELDGSPLGERVGFTVRGERKTSAQMRVEFVTAGVLLRRMLDDPGLDDTSAVIIDEVHERALETDLLIGLLGEVRELRDDLTLVAMSATLDAERIAAVLGSDGCLRRSSTTASRLIRSPSGGRRAPRRGSMSAASPARSSTMSPARRHPLPATSSGPHPTPTPSSSHRARARSPRSRAASPTSRRASMCGSCTGSCPRPRRTR